LSARQQKYPIRHDWIRPIGLWSAGLGKPVPWAGRGDVSCGSRDNHRRMSDCKFRRSQSAGSKEESRSRHIVRMRGGRRHNRFDRQQQCRKRRGQHPGMFSGGPKYLWWAGTQSPKQFNAHGFELLPKLSLCDSAVKLNTRFTLSRREMIPNTGSISNVRFYLPPFPCI